MARASSLLLLLAVVLTVAQPGCALARRLTQDSTSADVTLEWSNHIAYSPLNITVGQTVEFNWSGKVHDVATGTAPASCTDLTTVAEPASEGSYTATFPDAGTFYYACSVSDHCDEGQHITIHVATA